MSAGFLPFTDGSRIGADCGKSGFGLTISNPEAYCELPKLDECFCTNLTAPCPTVPAIQLFRV